MNGKKVDGFNVFMIIVMILIMTGGLVLLIIGLTYKIPSRSFNFYGIKEYVGGDAYNAIIESSIRGGEISGAMVTKALYICTGIITISLSAVGLKKKK